MKWIIVYAPHDGGISKYGPYDNRSAAADALRRKGWTDKFSAAEGEWLPRVGMGSDRTHATIEILDEPKVLPPNKLPGGR